MPKGLYIRTEAIKQKARGKNSGTWKGDKVGYQGIHIWLRKTFGKANKCEICGLTNTAKKKYFHWALLKGKTYQRKRENFWMLCLKCHRHYDDTVPKGWNKGLIGFNKGHAPTNTKPNIGSFKKGLVPWNKGKKGVMPTPWNKRIRKEII